jgi:hypothetical protein
MNDAVNMLPAIANLPAEDCVSVLDLYGLLADDLLGTLGERGLHGCVNVMRELVALHVAAGDIDPSDLDIEFAMEMRS